MKMLKKIYSYQTFLLLSILNVIIVITFGNFLPVDNGHRAINNEYFYFSKSNWSHIDPILGAKKNAGIRLGEEFLLSSTIGDQIQYMKMANGEESMEPYKFRLLYPFIVGRMIKLENAVGLYDFGIFKVQEFRNMDKFRIAQLNFWLLNFVSLIIASFFLYKVASLFTNDRLLKYSAVILLITQFSVLNVASFPMLDVFLYMLFIISLYLLLKKKYLLLAIFLILSVLTKEIMVIWSIALFSMFIETREKKLLPAAVFPIITFVLVRITMGSQLLNVGYNWNPVQGKMSLDYASAHVGSIGGIALQLIAMLFAFGILWIYLPKYKILSKAGLKYFFVTFLVSITLAQIILSSRSIRILAPVYPLFLLIPVLMFSQKKNMRKK